MKNYNIKLVGTALVFGITPTIASFYIYIAIIAILISFTLLIIWWSSQYPVELLKDITKVIDSNTALFLIIFAFIGSIGTIGTTLMLHTKQFLINEVPSGWSGGYPTFFTIIYAGPYTVLVWFLTRLYMRLKNPLQESGNI